jgi:hypothetical protein
MAVAFSAESIYGVPASPQPNAAPLATQPAGQPEPTMRTLPRPNAAGLLGDPVFAIVGLLGLAFLILHTSVHGSIGVSVG